MGPWVPGQVVGCSPMAMGMALWFVQAMDPESGGVFGPWLGRQVVGGSPSEVAMALWFWQALTPESAGLLPAGGFSVWSLSGEADPSCAAS